MIAVEVSQQAEHYLIDELDGRDMIWIIKLTFSRVSFKFNSYGCEVLSVYETTFVPIK